MQKLSPATPRNYPDLKEIGFDECYKNNLYTVLVRYIDNPVFGKGKHLSIKRNNKEVIHDWRDLQEIKNQLCGKEWEGLELYPADSRLVDSANQYHLWCFPVYMPIGFNERLVTGPKEAAKLGAKQRPF